jgi:hypothetical protein
MHKGGGDDMATRVKTVTVKGKQHAFDALTRPDALAVALGVSGKQLRGFLRSRYALGTPERNAMQPGGKASSWTLTRDAIAGAIKHYAPPKA